MRLNAKILKNVANVNHFEYASEAHVQEGQTNTIYLKLIDLDKDLGDGSYLRYLSQATVIGVEITFPSIDDSQIITITGSQPYTDDKSIWKFDLASNQLPNSGAINIKLTEDGVDKFFVVKAAIQVSLLNNGGC